MPKTGDDLAHAHVETQATAPYAWLSEDQHQRLLD
jgi:hypothetical protein